MINSICVIGAGTMGSGIAQVAAQNGYATILFDINAGVLDKAKAAIKNNLQYLAAKQKISVEQEAYIYSRINFVTTIDACVADFFIEAIVEKVEAKAAIFNQLAVINSDDAIFATNTSSLSVTAIQNNITHPHRVAGMHFFNPAPLMKLVEVVKGQQTSDDTATAVYELCKKLGKIPVMCKDAPGFIVNRVARHYYLQAMKLVQQGVAGFEEVDAIMEASGFKMGPFKLMDLIGMDVNLAVTQSMYSAFDNEKRFAPAQLQVDKVANGELGRKTGKGFYQY